MKHNDNAATQGFKSQVDRMQDYLKAAGFEVPRTHLMEAAARFGGARDWRTFRAELESVPVKKKVAVPNLNGKSVRVYFDIHAWSEFGEGPEFAWTDINQRWVDRVWELRALCEERQLSEIEDDFDPLAWTQNETYPMCRESMTVSKLEFSYTGRAKHARYDVGTTVMMADKFVEMVINAKGSELFILQDVGSIDALMVELGRDEDHPDFVYPIDESCIIKPDML